MDAEFWALYNRFYDAVMIGNVEELQSLESFLIGKSYLPYDNPLIFDDEELYHIQPEKNAKK